MTTRMDAVKKTMTDIMNLSIAGGEWDEQPVLFIVNNLGETVYLPIPGEVWAMAGHPLSLLEMMTKALTTPEMASPPLDDYFGEQVEAIIIFNEAWALDEAGIAAEAAQKYVDEGGRISEHPNRVEVKVIAAADVSGETAFLQYKRGQTGSLAFTEGQMEGRMPDAINQFLTAVRNHKN